MTRNERKKAYLRCLEMMERVFFSRDIDDALELAFPSDRKSHKEVYEILYSNNSKEWLDTNDQEWCKNIICLCIALCDQPV